MKRVVTVAAAALLVASSLGLASPAQAVCTRVQDHIVPEAYGATVPVRAVRVIVPPDYCDPDDSAEYPVLLLLHGAGDQWFTWTQNTDVVSFSADHDVIIVMPDGGHGNTPGNEAGWYSDWVGEEGREWESFHTGALVEYVEDAFRTLGNGHDGHWATAGLSMGGFGALKYLGRHPDTFAAGASFSGAVDMMAGWPASGAVFAFLHGQFGTPDDRVWGDQLVDHENWRAHNPTDLARRGAYAGKALFVITGTGTPGGHEGDRLEQPTDLGSYGLEHGIWQMHFGFVANLAVGGGTYNPGESHEHAAPAPGDFFYPGGYHGWPYWDSALRWALPQLVAAADGDGPPPLPDQAMGPQRGRGGGVSGR